MTGINFCTRIIEAAALHPERLALSVPRSKDGYCSSDAISYGELLAEVGRLQTSLDALGLKSGQRVLVFSRPAIPLYVLLIAMLARGLVPVLVDRGMSRERLLAAMRLSKAAAVMGDRDVLKFWWWFPPLWTLPRYALDGSCFGVRDLRNQERRKKESRTDAKANCTLLTADAHGLITFTSGSTGRPKGADRTHGSLLAQHLAIREHWPDRDDDIDMPCFPVLVLHNLCCGISTMLPPIDLATPGNINAERVIAGIKEGRITRIAAAPAFMQGLTRHAMEHGIVLPQIRSLIVGGSTLTRELVEHCLQVFPQAEARVVYGSTEAEPIADIHFQELLAGWNDEAGQLVGHIAANTEVCIVNPALPLNNADDVMHARQAPGTVGEILVAGPHVLHRYVDDEAATRENKILRSDGLVWHRTGDTGFFDSTQGLWLVGRLKDALTGKNGGVYTFALEKTVDALPGIARSALIMSPDEKSRAAILVIQGSIENHLVCLKEILQNSGLARIHLSQINNMPVDGRHNSKIDRAALRDLWQRRKLSALTTFEFAEQPS